MSILYVMNGSLDNIKVLGQVITFAKRQHATLTLLDIIESLPRSTRMMITAMTTANLRDNVVRNRLAQIEALASSMGSEDGEIRSRVRFGRHSNEITREAAESGYDLVIKTPGKDRTDRYLLRNCNCPVWLLKADDNNAYGQLIPSHSPAFNKPENERRAATRNQSQAGHYRPGTEICR